jgi:hypothetical protein
MPIGEAMKVLSAADGFETRLTRVKAFGMGPGAFGLARRQGRSLQSELITDL